MFQGSRKAYIIPSPQTLLSEAKILKFCEGRRQYERCNGKIKTSYLDKQLLRTTAGEREGNQTNGKWTCRLPQRALAHSKPEDKVSYI
jgi:hypothetical protein